MDSAGAWECICVRVTCAITRARFVLCGSARITTRMPNLAPLCSCSRRANKSILGEKLRCPTLSMVPGTFTSLFTCLCSSTSLFRRFSWPSSVFLERLTSMRSAGNFVSSVRTDWWLSTDWELDTNTSLFLQLFALICRFASSASDCSITERHDGVLSASFNKLRFHPRQVTSLNF